MLQSTVKETFDGGMWTNVFRIGGIHHISWFQFLPLETDVTPLHDKSPRADERDAATLQVLSSHLQLQKEGFLTTWTNSFVGPWDPSQGLHNPDKIIKLWLFIPGRHLSVSDTAQPLVSKLRVIASGVWIAPGDSEEVAIALSQALRNRIERSLLGLSYLRFGDIFSRHHPASHVEEFLRKGQPVIEFVFSASEEAIFVHAIISAKLVRALSAGDIQRLSKLCSDDSSGRLPVVVAPHGMRGRLTGCCDSDLVKQMSSGSGALRSSTCLVGLPYRSTENSYLGGRNCCAEVTLGCTISGSGTAKNSSLTYNKSIPNIQTSCSPSIVGVVQKGSGDDNSICERTFIYPKEAVLVPVLQTSYGRSSLKRLWLQNWMGPSLSSSTTFMHCIAGEMDSMDDSWMQCSGKQLQFGDNSSSNSNSSSLNSASSGSSDSKMNVTAGELEADADSLTCRESGLSAMDVAGSKQGNKRPRTAIQESFGQMGTVINTSAPDGNKSDFNGSAITGLTIDQIGSHWDWDNDDNAVGMDIQALLSEFGDFGDFFENDVLPFGEPPGTAESEAMMFSGPDGEDVVGTSAGVMDVSDQMFLPSTFPTFESFNPPLPTPMEECASTAQEAAHGASSSDPVSCGPGVPSSEFDHVMKDEAFMTFAAEYGAVATPPSEVSSTIFRCPYVPKSAVPETPSSSGNSYVYSATPPSSPCCHAKDDKPGSAVDSRACSGKCDIDDFQRQKLYTHVGGRRHFLDRKSITYNDKSASSEGAGSSLLSGFSSASAKKSVKKESGEVTFYAEHLFLSSKTINASELECLLYQASMCRIRHTLFSSGNSASAWHQSTGNLLLSHLPSDPSSITDDFSTKFDVKKKESVPVRIAGDIDDGMLEGTLNVPVGVWRSVGVPKVAKPGNMQSNEVFPSFSNNAFGEISYGQRQPLQDFLDGIVLLVQQAASFVDVTLDSESGDGPYGWLALQEQWRRGFCCGPHMVHAGCGGVFAYGHSLDVAGVELVDPLSADVHPSSVISFLQADIKSALKTVFGSLDGPLSVTDWCKGCQSGDAGTMSDGFSSESTLSECRDSSSNVTTSVGDSLSPLQSSAGKPSNSKDGSKERRSNQELCMPDSEQQLGLRRKPRIFVLPHPSILVGYQDDWLKTSAGSLQFWEKAPFEPYATQKHVVYHVVCPNIDPLTAAAADFFQQLGSVYETCKLGTHSPQSFGNESGTSSGKLSSSGFVLLDCPQSMKIEGSSTSLVGSLSDYFLSLSNGWDVTSFLKSLSKVLKSLNLGLHLNANAKEGNSSFTVIYIVCPFPDQTAILQTIVESCVAIGSLISSAAGDRRSILHSQVGKALSCSTGIDEASVSNILTLSGFSIPKLVLQIVTVDTIFRVTSPMLSELIILKEVAFTVYNKSRRISRGSSSDLSHSSSFPGRPQNTMTQMGNSVPGMWKEVVSTRISGTSLPRESEMDPGLQGGNWNNTWQASRSGGLGCDGNRAGDFLFQDELHFIFEPLFILSEPGSLDHAFSSWDSAKQMSDECSMGGHVQGLTSPVIGDTGSSSSQLDGLESDSCGHQKSPPSLHCCYGWTEDWRWMVCVWTDSRGELLDCHIFPFGGVSSRQDTKGLQSLFVQVLQQGCQILQTCGAPDNGVAKPRDLVITRIGFFFELEYQEWLKALYYVGGSELKKWPVQLRRASSDGGGGSLQQQDIERSLPSSPSSMYSPHSKPSGFMKGAMGQPSVRKQLLGGAVDNSRGLIQWVQSVSFVSVSVDHCLQLVHQAEASSGGTQGSVGSMGSLSYLEGYTPVKSLGSVPASYIFSPSPTMRFLSPAPLQLPTCLTSESPPLAHLLHSRGAAMPLSTCFVVTKSVPSLRKNSGQSYKEEWPSVLSVSLVDYYGGYGKGIAMAKQGRESEAGEGRPILESIAAELHALSWMTVSPAYLERRSALPFHCDTVLRLRRLLHFAEKHLSRESEKITS